MIFGIMKDRSLLINTLVSLNRFTCRNLVQNGANDTSMSEMVNMVDSV